MPAAKGAHAHTTLPPAPKLRKLIGPSFILLGLGLGSGEVILWPYLTANFGLGMTWAILVGITMQFFINMEATRYALIHGESVFVGFARRWKRLPLWFIVSTFLGFGWPGIGLAGAMLIAGALGYDNVQDLAITVFLVIGLLLSLGRVLYKTVEKLQMIVIGVGFPFLLILTLVIAHPVDLRMLIAGLWGQGEGFRFLPLGLPLATFLGALAYTGAGGNLNLAQSCYVRDKGYGMGRFADRITSIITGRGAAKEFSLKGSAFKVDEDNLARFRKWWRVTNLEHLIIFWLLGFVTILLLSLLAYATTFGAAGSAEGIHFIVLEAAAIASRSLPIFGMLFLLATGLMLLATQLTVLDSTSRIMTENALLLTRRKTARVSLWYFVILWAQILFGIGVLALGFDQPRELIVLGAVVNAFAMFVATGLLFLFNNRALPKALRPSLLRNAMLLGAFVFLGFFCGVTMGSYLV